MASPQAKRRLAAILAAGSVDHSRLAGSDDAETLARLRLFRQRMIHSAIGTHRGRIIKSTSDELLVAFSSAVDAVHCALTIQRTLDEHEMEMPQGRQIVFRIAINVGDVVVDTAGNLMGDGVNMATRLESIAEPGGISLSRTAYDQVKDKLDLVVRDQGLKQLRTTGDPVQVFAIDRSHSVHAMRQFGSRVLKAALAGVVLIAAIVAGVFLLTQ
jgi:adenylate cyclase